MQDECHSLAQTSALKCKKARSLFQEMYNFKITWQKLGALKIVNQPERDAQCKQELGSQHKYIIFLAHTVQIATPQREQ